MGWGKLLFSLFINNNRKVNLELKLLPPIIMEMNGYQRDGKDILNQSVDREQSSHKIESLLV